MMLRELRIKEFDFEQIRPSTNGIMDPEHSGFKVIVIGKSGSGKSSIIKALLYSKKHIIPIGEVHSGTEDTNDFYKQMFPSTFIYNGLRIDKMKDFKKRQKIAKRYVENPWGIVICDDVCDDSSILGTTIFHDFFKNGRHWKMLYVIALQYALDVKPAIRGNVDGVFILRDRSLTNRKKLFENYASVIGDFRDFCEIMDTITDDWTALYIDNNSSSNKMEDCVFWYKIPRQEDIPDFKFGCNEFWEFHEDRYDSKYIDPME